MNLNTGKDAIRAITEKIKQFFSKGKGAEAASKAGITGLPAKITPSAVLKTYGALSIAEFAAKPIDDLMPHLVETGNKITVMPFKYTIGLIPGVRKIMSKLTNFQGTLLELAGMPTLAKWSHQMADAVNDPSYYEHVTKDDDGFMIPGNYNNTMIDIAAGTSTVNIPSVVTFKMVKPFWINANAANLRVTNIYTIVTSAMKVSHTVYGPKHILALTAQIQVASLFHTLLKKMISASQATSSLKPNMPKAIIKQIGFDPDEVSTNIALYLDYYHLWVSKINKLGLHTFGFSDNKIQSTLTLLKDSAIDNCTYYNMQYLLPTNADVLSKVLNDQLVVYPVQHDRDTPTPLDHYYWNYQKIHDYGEDILTAICQNEEVNKLVADMTLLFGSSKLVKYDTDLIDLYAKAKRDELQLSTLKNADIDLCMQPKAIYSYAGGSTSVQRMGAIEVEWKPSTSGSIQVSYENDVYTGAEPAGITVNVPATEKWNFSASSVGSGTSFTLQGAATTQAQIMNLHKKKVLDGEAYEVITKKFYVSPTATVREIEDNRVLMKLTVKPLLEVIVDIVNDNSFSAVIEHDFLYSFTDYTNSSEDINPKTITLWSLCDYLPRMRVQLKTGAYYEMWDLDNVGELTDYLFEKAHYNITYSFLFPDIKVQLDRGKQIESLIDLYNK